MESSNTGGVVRLIAATLILLLAVLAILFVLDVVPREALARMTAKLLAIGAILAAASVAIALVSRR